MVGGGDELFRALTREAEGARFWVCFVLARERLHKEWRHWIVLPGYLHRIGQGISQEAIDVL